MNLKVSVVMPVYNREESVKDSIFSVLRQTMSQFELIIVDDGSVDNTVDVIKTVRDDRIRLICLEENKGASYARNIGIEAACGQYIAFIDSDDQWTIEKLDEQLKYMEENELEISFTPYIIDKENRIVPKDFERYFIYNNIKSILQIHNIIGTPTLIVNRKIILAVGGFDESLPRLQDYELAIKLVQEYKIGCCNKILLHVGSDSSNRITYNTDKLFVSLGMILDRHFDFINLYDENSIFVKSFFDENGLLNSKRIAEIEGYSKYHALEWMKAILLEVNRRGKICYENKNMVRNYNISKLVNTDSDYVIWGAGTKGKEFYYTMKPRGLRPTYFVVSEKGEEEQIDGIDVVAVNELDTINYEVVVAVAQDKQNEILKKIQRCDFQMVIIL